MLAFTSSEGYTWPIYHYVHTSSFFPRKTVTYAHLYQQKQKKKSSLLFYSNFRHYIFTTQTFPNSASTDTYQHHRLHVCLKNWFPHCSPKYTFLSILLILDILHFTSDKLLIWSLKYMIYFVILLEWLYLFQLPFMHFPVKLGSKMHIII